MYTHSETENIHRVQADDWGKQCQEQAQHKFHNLAWPDPENEEYRRTDLTNIDFNKYQPAKTRGPLTEITVDPTLQYEIEITLSATQKRVVYQNQTGKALAKILGINELLEEKEWPLTDLIGRGIQKADNRFEVWNYSELVSPTALLIPQGQIVEKPIFIDITGEYVDRLISPNLIIILEEQAQAEFLVRYKSADNADVLFNPVTNIIGGQGSQCRITQIQSTGNKSLFFDHSYARLDREAKLERVEVHTGGALVKTRFVVNLDENSSEANLYGLSYGTENRHFDLRTVQRHNALGTTSRCLYKNAVGDKARIVHQGLIQVTPQAPKTDAYLTSKNLILSSLAQADAIPALKIDTNDVRCSHGASSGPVDKNQLFYLATRGIPEKEARNILIEAYFEEILAHVPAAISPYIYQELSLNPKV